MTLASAFWFRSQGAAQEQPGWNTWGAEEPGRALKQYFSSGNGMKCQTSTQDSAGISTTPRSYKLVNLPEVLFSHSPLMLKV